MTTPAEHLDVLLIEDNPDHAALVQRHLEREGGVRICHAPHLAAGLEALDRRHIDAVLTDLWLPDSAAPDTLARIIQHAPEVPVVVLTALDDLELGISAVQNGAQDYLVKAQLTGELLVRALRYAIERKRAQAELERYMAELERSNRELQQFAHVVSHDLKSPLAVVQLNLQQLLRYKDCSLGGAAAECIQDAVTEVKRMSALIDGLLRYAEVGAERPGFGPVDCHTVLDQALANLQVLIRQSEAVITHDPLPTIPGDPIQLLQLFQNLIENALKYRSDAQPRIHLSVRRGREDWQFSLRDNGIGIPTDQLGRVFRMFERLRPEACPGSGIGLAICKRVVELHGGRISIDSQPGQGCVFHFTLRAQWQPLVAAEAKAPPPSVALPAVAPASSARAPAQA